MENELSQIPQALEIPISTLFPLQDLLFGVIVLLLVMLFHAISLRMINRLFYRWNKHIAARLNLIGPDLFFSFILFLLLTTHLTEITIWTTIIIKSGILGDWRAAGYYVANTYTMLGYGSDILPTNWKMVTPIIAISGLFTFGWTGSALVNFISDFKQSFTIKN